MTRQRWTAPAALAVIAALAVSGCGNEEPAQPKEKAADAGTYVGKVEDTNANIGLVVRDNQIAGFVCENKESWLTLARTDLNGDKATLKAEDGTDPGTEVSVTISRDRATGTVSFEEVTATFTAEKATGDAGVYRVPGQREGEPWKGWVVLNDGSYTGNAKGKPSSGQPWVDPDSQP